MELSPLQARALDDVADWYHNSDEQVFRLFGYAGTGKSTIANRFIELLDQPTVVATFTGKAASVLRRKGVPQARTIHSAVYTVVPPDKQRIVDLMKAMTEVSADKLPSMREELRELNKPRFALNVEDSPLLDAGLCLIDECSMVNEDLGTDLESFGKKILVLGDPGQLPPVGGAGYFTNRTPDFLLDEIHRQAADSPIIALATQVRKGERLKVGNYGTSSVKYGSVIPFGDRLAADQVIVGKNATRIGTNKRFRLVQGINSPLPVQKEKLICLKNDKERGLLNGTMWTVENVSEGRWLDLRIKSLDEEGDPIDVSCHREPFLGQSMDEIPFWQRKMAQEFDFGNAITCHKAQGSQWDYVFLENEAYCFRDQASKWLYTGITRAADRIQVAL